jgi:uncharacterized protein with von Willebrand factor type A (vWA) domain
MVLRVDDRSVQLRALGTDTEVPLHISLLIDVSLSQRGMDKFYAHALLGMKAGLHRGRDQVNIYTFGSAVRLFHGWEDAGSLDAAAIEHIDSKSGAVLQKRPFYRIGGTRLFDAVSDAIANDNGVDGRKAILILSDGVDEDSNVTSGSALRSAEQGDVSITALEFAPTGPTFSRQVFWPRASTTRYWPFPGRAVESFSMRFAVRKMNRSPASFAC